MPWVTPDGHKGWSGAELVIIFVKIHPNHMDTGMLTIPTIHVCLQRLLKLRLSNITSDCPA